MLSLRMIIVAAIAGICFWGLFQLLDNLKEPALLRSTKGVAVKGCASLEDHKDAARLCPQFLCQKALIERKLVALDSQFAMNVDAARDGARIVSGTVVSTGQAFACNVAGVKVTQAQLIEDSEERR
jgi:type III secretory pathway component EscS